MVADIPWIVLPARSVSPEAGPAKRILLDPLRLMHERHAISDPAIYVLRPDTFVGGKAPLLPSDRAIAHLDRILCDPKWSSTKQQHRERR